ncbi:MAG: pilin [Candidatus Pacebacteria bacterium]|nr:pilin [Candidatus Paceibacterota bacterium]
MKNNKKIIGLITLLSIVFVMAFGIFGVANAQPEVLKECIKIRQDFKIKVITGDQDSKTGGSDVQFRSGAIVAPKAIDSPGSIACMRGDKPVTIATGATCKSEVKDGMNCYLYDSKNYGIVGMFNIIYNITNWVFFIMTLVAVLMIVYGGFVYITAAGDPAKAGSGKSILTFAIIGLAIALIAKLIPSLVRFILRV